MTKTEIETKYLSTIQPLIGPAMAGDREVIEKLEHVDKDFWKVHDVNIYQLIQRHENHT